MSDFWVIYLFSILDNVHATTSVVGAVSLLLLIFAGILVGLSLGYSIDDEVLAALKKPMIWGLGIGLISITLNAFIPTTSSMIKAYALVEGSKVLNAENAEKTAVEVTERIDRLMGILEGRLNKKE